MLLHRDAGGLQQQSGQPSEHRPALGVAHAPKPHRIDRHAQLARRRPGLAPSTACCGCGPVRLNEKIYDEIIDVEL